MLYFFAGEEPRSDDMGMSYSYGEEERRISKQAAEDFIADYQCLGGQNENWILDRIIQLEDDGVFEEYKTSGLLDTGDQECDEAIWKQSCQNSHNLSEITSEPANFLGYSHSQFHERIDSRRQDTNRPRPIPAVRMGSIPPYLPMSTSLRRFNIFVSKIPRSLLEHDDTRFLLSVHFSADIPQDDTYVEKFASSITVANVHSIRGKVNDGLPGIPLRAVSMAEIRGFPAPDRSQIWCIHMEDFRRGFQESSLADQEYLGLATHIPSLEVVSDVTLHADQSVRSARDSEEYRRKVEEQIRVFSDRERRRS